jgi:hypothetical protein
MPDKDPKSESSDAAWARPADAGAVGEEPPPAQAAPVTNVPPPDAATLASSSAATAAAQTSTWATPAGAVDKPRQPGSIAASLPVGAELAQERPEVLVAAAFGGAFVFAQILKRLTSG